LPLPLQKDSGELMYRHESNAGLNRPKFDVLIVEDEPISRKALSALVEARGYHTDSVASAEDALKRFAQNGIPGIVLVDLDLPGMSGMDLIKRLQALNPKVFPVLITAAPGEQVEHLRRQHPVAYLRKPLDFDRLMTLISERRSFN